MPRFTIVSLLCFLASWAMASEVPAPAPVVVTAEQPGLWFRSIPGETGWKNAGWREPWNQTRHMTMVPDGASTVLDIAVVAKAEANVTALPGSPVEGLHLRKQWVYEISFEARCVGQIEDLQLMLRRRSNPYTVAGVDRFPISKDWAVYTTQIRPQVDDDDTQCIFFLKGMGNFQVRWLQVERRAEFRLPDGMADKPVRGELLANGDFSLGSNGWHYNTPSWDNHTAHFFALPPEQRPGFFASPVAGSVAGSTPQQIFRAAPGIVGFLTWNEPLQLRLGRHYRVTVSGQGAAEDVFFWFARSGQNISIIQKIPLNFVNGVATGSYHHAIPTHGTLSNNAEQIYVRVEHFGKAALDLRSISLREVESEEAKPVDLAPGAIASPRTAVSITGLDQHLHAVARAGQKLSARIQATGLSSTTTQGMLEIRSAGEAAIRSIPVPLQPDAAGNALAEIRLPDLPLGWYEARVRVANSATADSATADSVLLAARFAIVPPLPQNFVPRPFFGLHMPSIEPQAIAFLASLGIGHARCFEYNWATVEPQQGVDGFPLAIAERYRAAGVSSMVILNGTPKWSSSAPQNILDDAARRSWDQDHWSHYPPQSDAAWEHYVRTMVRSMKGKGVDSYEIWNEPNGYYMQHNPERDASMEAAYVRLARTAYAAIKAEDPQAIVVVGATAGQATDFFRKAFALGLINYCDAVSYHAYGEVGREMFGAQAFASTISNFNAMMQEHGGVKPLWDSESGASIDDGLAGLDASLTLIQGLVAREAAGLARYYIYSGEARSFPLQKNFHMVTGFADRPLVSVPLLSVYACLLSEATFTRSLDVGADAQLYEFTHRDGHLIRIGWNMRTTATVTVPGSSGVLLDAFGRQIGTLSDGAIELCPQPRWIVDATTAKRLTAVSVTP